MMGIKGQTLHQIDVKKSKAEKKDVLAVRNKIFKQEEYGNLHAG